MKCSNCGANIPEGSKFCRECGATAMDPTQALAQVAEATGAGVTQPTVAYDSLGAGYVTPDTEADQPKRKNGKLIALVAALLVVALAIGGFFAANSCTKDLPAPEPPISEPAIGTTQVSFSVNAAYYDEPGSRLPVQITGTTVEGETVNKTIYITVNSTTVTETIELEDGTYAYEATGSPISANGLIYEFADIQGGFTLTAGEGNVDVQPAIEVELTPIDPVEVTDEQIEAAVEAAAADEECADIAEELGAVATQLRDEYVKAAEEEAARVAAEEAARQAAEEEAARKAAEEEAQRAAEEAAIEASSEYNCEWFYIPDASSAGWVLIVTPLSDTEWQVEGVHEMVGEPNAKGLSSIMVSAGEAAPDGFTQDNLVGYSQGSDGTVYGVWEKATLGGYVFNTSGLAGGDHPTIVIKNPV